MLPRMHGFAKGDDVFQRAVQPFAALGEAILEQACITAGQHRLRPGAARGCDFLDDAANHRTAGADDIFLSAGTFLLTIDGDGEGNSLTGDLDINDEHIFIGAESPLEIFGGHEVVLCRCCSGGENYQKRGGKYKSHSVLLF